MIRKRLTTLIAITLCLNLTACGYLLYPERVGQRSGQLDPTVILLDAGGLLIGILPGVVAFAVDLATGTIFLSPGEKSAIEKHGKTFSSIEELKRSPAKPTDIKIDRTKTVHNLSALLGRSIDESKIEYYKPAKETPVLLSLVANPSF